MTRAPSASGPSILFFRPCPFRSLRPMKAVFGHPSSCDNAETAAEIGSAPWSGRRLRRILPRECCPAGTGQGSTHRLVASCRRNRSCWSHQMLELLVHAREQTRQVGAAIRGSPTRDFPLEFAEMYCVKFSLRHCMSRFNIIKEDPARGLSNEVTPCIRPRVASRLHPGQAAGSDTGRWAGAWFSGPRASAMCAHAFYPSKIWAAVIR